MIAFLTPHVESFTQEHPEMTPEDIARSGSLRQREIEALEAVKGVRHGGEVRGMGWAGRGCGRATSTRSTSRSQVPQEVLERIIEERVEERTSQIRTQLQSELSAQYEARQAQFEALMQEKFAAMFAEQQRRHMEHASQNCPPPTPNQDYDDSSELMRVSPLPTGCGYSRDEAVPETELQHRASHPEEGGEATQPGESQVRLSRKDKGKGKAPGYN